MCASTKWLCSHTIVLICVNNQPKFCEKKTKSDSWFRKSSYLCIVKRKQRQVIFNRVES